MDLAAAQAGLKRSDLRVTAKVLRAVDEREPWTHALFSSLHAWLAERRKVVHVVGVTGSPGAGKSTVVDALKVAQSNVVVLTPGMGDDIQAIKAGILEIADVYLVNKADRDGAHKLCGDIRSMLNLLPHADGTVNPPVLESIATERKGIDT